jgi:PQQ-like domain
MRLMSTFFLIILALSCKKEPIVPRVDPPVHAPSKLEIVWQIPIVPDTSEHSTSPQTLVEGGIAFSTNFTSPTAFVQMREAGNGAFRWKFDNFILPVDGFLRNQIHGLHNKVIINKWHRTYCVDALNGHLDWAQDVTNDGGAGEPHIHVYGDYVYKANYTGSKPKSTSESVVRAYYLQGQWDTLLTITAKDSFHLNIYPPTLWINPQGDSVLIIRDNGLRDVLATPYEGRYNLVNLYAWNMRTRQYEWKLEDFEDERSIDINPPAIDGNHLFLHSKNYVYCLDLTDGSLVWKKYFADDIYFGNIVQHKNTIILHGDDHGLWALDKSNGAIVWYNNSTGTVVEMLYFDGIVYYVSVGSGRLYAINAETGATIWAEYSRTKKPNATFGLSTVVIDPERRYLYTADSYFMMCVKLPEL